MTWDPTIPATSTDLLSAPVRGNFAALDTAVMAALNGMANGAVLYRTTGPVIAGIPAVAAGSVLASTGVATAPTWNASPTLTGVTLSGMTAGSILFAGTGGLVSRDTTNLFWDDANNNLRLFGATVGTSGVGVLALGPGTWPTTSPVDTVQLTTVDMQAEAGSRGLSLRDERGGVFELGSVTTNSITALTMWNVGGTAVGGLNLSTSSLSLTTATNTPVLLYVNNTIVWLHNGSDLFLRVASTPYRLISTGPVDSGGAGWRTLIIQN